jgi:thiol:disulfide interchange protein DsbC
MYMKILGILMCLLISSNLFAGPEEEQAIRKSISTVLPDLKVDLIEESAIPGLYTVVIGAEIFYVTPDGQYLLRGDLIDLSNKTNLSEEKRTIARRGILKTVPADQFITFHPETIEHTVYVFTDITCGFCQKLQSEVKDINKRGIAINYLAFPRAGLNTVTSKKMESVWCAENREEAFVDAMIGLDVRPKDCNNPVVDHFGLGQAMGVRGTPAIFTEDGRYLPGYMPPDDLLKAIEQTN